MNDEEQQRFIEEQNIKITAICKDIFNEEPIAEELKEVVRKHDVEGKGNNLKESFEAKKSISSRVYGLSSVKKALSQISGKWARYMMLMEKDELSKSEQEELSKMFR